MEKPQQNLIPQKWTSGNAQLVFRGKKKLEIMLLRKNGGDKIPFRRHKN